MSRPSHAIPRLPHSPAAFVWHYVHAYPVWYLLILGLQLGAAISATLIPYAIGQLTTAISDGIWRGSEVLHQSSAAVGVLALFAALAIIFERANGAVLIVIRPRQKRRITGDLFAYLRRHSHRYFAEHFAGSLSQRVSETTLGVLDILFLVSVELLPILTTLVVSLVLLSLASPWLGASLLAWTLLFVGISYCLARRAQPFAKAHAEARSRTSGNLVDTITNLASVRLFARGDYEQRYLDGYLCSEKAAARRSFWFMERIRWFQDAMALLLRLGLVVLALHLWGRGQINVGEFVMTVTLGMLIVTNARFLSYQFLHFFEASGNIENGVRTLLQPHDMRDLEQAQDRQVPGADIELRDLTFGYDPERPIFQQVNLHIPAGQRVGVVGYSGSGKSTLLSLLLRLYDPQQGAVLLGGVDIRSLTQDALHRQISLIPQEPGLFHRSLAENIGYGRPDASAEAIHDAARQAYADTFIRDIPDGYETLVGERGVKLSGGQRQRVAIARVLLKDAPVLIMDEATSSLDSHTEHIIQQSLEWIMGDKTVIVVAHRLSTIAQLDRILVFDQGRIVEDGSHSDLLARGGIYHSLWAHQSDGRIHDEGRAPAADQVRDEPTAQR
ncbi:ATP-binding cassette, subfamily B [Pseudomonas flavescens]|uniref:ATP-binding cassette, subfamily B n=1 Tax=Phytopseudomonas flavescens TaxID=29435 RepID=A0A1G8PK51_9GAMM|nr:ABC transporter ATP-binding protein [Pseudomonas flavescens]SDI92863.1 ATP-binding cassette, subfamily B [Pseudomonas flavescens]